MTENIFAKLKKFDAAKLTEADWGWVIPPLLAFYDRRLRYLAAHAYSIRITDDGFELSFRAFQKAAEERIKAALSTFYLDKKHWLKGRDIKPYLNVTIENLSNELYWEYSGRKKLKSRSFACPLCKDRGFKQTLKQSGDMLKCELCQKSLDFLLEKIGTGEDLADVQNEYLIRGAFAEHSVDGLRCPDCLRFIPASSSSGVSNIACPYGDCHFFGYTQDLLKMNHPTTTTVKPNIMATSLDSLSLHFDNSVQEYLSSYDVNAEEFLLFHEDMMDKIKMINEVIDGQLAEVKRNSFDSTRVQKMLMYKAYRTMLGKHPADMIHYLCHRKQVSEPLQAKIFQTYVSIVEGFLPFTMYKGGKDIDIISLTDSNLSLFQGISEFEATVQEDYSIPNLTKEVYIGGRSYHNYGPCFIGRLISILDSDHRNSLMDKVESYSFSKIQMSEDMPIGTSVIVRHFRILSHYEMDSLVFLQRIRKRLVDSLYFRLHNKKREVRA